MKILMIIISSLALLSTTSCSKEVPWYSNPEEPFWQLGVLQIPVMDINLESGESQEIEIVTDKAILVGMKPKVTIQQYQQYTSQKPITLQDMNSYTYVSSISSATLFEPVDGRINIKAINNSDIAFTFVVYKEGYDQ